MYYSAIGLLAAIVLLIENQDILLHSGDGFNGPSWKVYKQFLVAVLVYYASDIMWGVLESGKAAGPLFVDTSIYFIAMAVGVELWTRYMVVYLGERSLFERLLLVIGRVIAVLTAVNVFYPVVFTVDANCVYQELGFRDAILVSQVALLCSISVYALSSITRRREEAIDHKRYRTLGLFGLVMGACLAAQLWYPLLPLYAIGYMLGTCLIRAFVIGDEKEEYRRGYEEANRVAELKQSITSLLDNMPVMSFSKDVETGVYLACNQPFVAYAHKRTPDEVIGLTDYEMFDKDTAAHFVEQDRKALAMDRPYVFYEDVTDAEGNPRYLQTTKLQFCDSSGRVCLLGMSMDITEMEQAKAAYHKALSTSTIYENIVHALCDDYFNLFYVDLSTDEFVEYGLRTELGQQGTENHGTDFFAVSRANAKDLVYEEDLERIEEALEKETLLNEVNKNGCFMIQYRLLIDGSPTYVNLKATRIDGDDQHLIVGVNNIDAQTRDRAIALRAEEERKSYLRLSAFNGNLIALYYVNLQTNEYVEYSSTHNYAELGIAKQGDDFFGTTYSNSLWTVYPEDQTLFQSLVTKKNILRAIEQDGVFAIDYRLVINGKQVYVRLKAAQIVEDGLPMLIVGVLDEDAQIRREQGYVHDLSVARRMATVDALTGVKNKYAYAQREEKLNAEIDSGVQEPFAVVVCDINDLKDVNDKYGHKAGDVCIKRACKRICDEFDHSPVFRVGGDEFVVLLMGQDYAKRVALVEEINKLPEVLSSIGPGDTISAGMVEYNRDRHNSLLSVFEEADMAMYERKQFVKSVLTR